MAAFLIFWGGWFILFVGVLLSTLVISEKAEHKCDHEFEEIKSICSTTRTAFICKKCGKVKKVKLK